MNIAKDHFLFAPLIYLGASLKPIDALLLSVIISIILTFALFIFFSQVIQPLIAARLGLKGGCNLAMVQITSFDLFDAERRLDKAKQAVGADTNETATVQANYSAVQKHCEFWKEDVRRRGQIPEY